MRREKRRYAMPHRVALRMAVQQQKRRAATSNASKYLAGRGVDPARLVAGVEVGKVWHLIQTRIEH
jgi:hypothetical protein